MLAGGWQEKNSKHLNLLSEFLSIFLLWNKNLFDNSFIAV